MACQDDPLIDQTGEKIDPWLCHVCGDGYGYRNERGVACAICFQLACQNHIDFIVVPNEKYHQPELKPVCSVCQKNREEQGHT